MSGKNLGGLGVLIVLQTTHAQSVTLYLPNAYDTSPPALSQDRMPSEKPLLLNPGDVTNSLVCLHNRFIRLTSERKVQIIDTNWRNFKTLRDELISTKPKLRKGREKEKRLEPSKFLLGEGRVWVQVILLTKLYSRPFLYFQASEIPLKSALSLSFNYPSIYLFICCLFFILNNGNVVLFA